MSPPPPGKRWPGPGVASGCRATLSLDLGAFWEAGKQRAEGQGLGCACRRTAAMCSQGKKVGEGPLYLGRKGPPTPRGASWGGYLSPRGFRRLICELMTTVTMALETLTGCCQAPARL